MVIFEKLRGLAWTAFERVVHSDLDGLSSLSNLLRHASLSTTLNIRLIGVCYKNKR